MENKKIKICHVANTDKAVKFLLLPQLKFLVQEGYDVCVACSSGKWTDDIEVSGIKVKNIEIKRKISPVSDLVSLLRLFLYFKKEKFDIVHTHTPKPGLLGQLAARMAGVPVVINTIHGLYFHENSSRIRRGFFITMEKIAASCSDLIFSQNKEDIGTLIKEKIAKPDKIKYLGNGVDIEKFNSQKFTKEFIDKKKKELGVPTSSVVIGIVARLVREKGYLDLFEAFKIILKDFPRTTLLIAGAEEPEKKDGISRDVVKKYNIEENVIFLGERGDIEEMYPLMDVFVLPSYREGFPRSILEAMAEKRPIIASDIRGCREEIDSGKNGVLVPTKNPERLAEAIMFILNNRDRAKDLGEGARAKVEKYFNEAIVFGRIKEEYKKLTREILNTKKSKKVYFFVKIILDLIFSLIGLILVSPILIIIAVLIKLDSEGPILYKGERIGRFGKPFKILKFRTMVPNAEKIGAIHAARNDPRVTKVGRVLRTYKLDELPQLINIIKGQMSFVGPRPQVKYYVDLYNDEERTSLSVLPGMTDYATIFYVNQEDLVDEKNVDKSYQENIEPQKNKLRIEYVRKASFLTDAKIIFQTFLAIVKKIILKKK
jgi:lipopolysaccharide/colanic/teichoic acid biosynthesis glycosyltransferase